MRKQRIFWLAALTILLSGGFCLCFYALVWKPCQQYKSLSWWEKASMEERRLLCHRVVSYRIADPHNAFMSLIEIGNWESVPILIEGLKRLNPSSSNDNTRTHTCTEGLCESALGSITGEDYGLDWRMWRKWWTSKGKFQTPPAWISDPDAVQISGATIIERGIYTSSVVDTNSDRGIGGDFDPPPFVSSPFVRSATNIPAVRGVIFGLRYRIDGSPRERPFTVSTRWIHPPIQDLRSGELKTLDVEEATTCMGPHRTSLRWLRDDRLVVPGTWTFQLWHGDRKLCEQSFELVATENAD
jgi:hypothetical protein